MAGQRLEQVEGVVKWFDPRKGFGFIVAPDGRDVFVHYSVIEGDGFRALRDGSSVIYDAVGTEQGWRATRVERPAPDVETKAQQGHARTPRR